MSHKPETSVYVLFNDVVIGAIRTLHVDEKEDSIRLEAHPMRLLYLRLGDLFQRNQVHPAAQKLPFTIVIEDVFEHTMVKTTISNVWLKSIDSTYTGEDFVVLGHVTGTAESIDVKEVPAPEEPRRSQSVDP